MELTTSETYRYRTKSAKHEMDNFGNMTPSEHVSRSRGTKWKNDTPIFERLSRSIIVESDGQLHRARHRRRALFGLRPKEVSE